METICKKEKQGITSRHLDNFISKSGGKITITIIPNEEGGHVANVVVGDESLGYDDGRIFHGGIVLSDTELPHYIGGDIKTCLDEIGIFIRKCIQTKFS